MKRILLYLVFTTIAFSLNAQEAFSDKIELKNGSIFYGKLIQLSAYDSIKLQLESGQIMQFGQKDLKKVKMAKPILRGSDRTPELYNFREKGFYHASAFALNFGKSNFAGNRITRAGMVVSHVSGYQFGRLLGAGVGLSFDDYYLSEGESAVVSAVGEVRSYFHRRNNALYATFSAGYGLPVRNKNENFSNYGGGLVVYPTVGYRFGSAARPKFFVDLGFKIQNVKFERTFDNAGEYVDTFSVAYRRWVLRGGILF